jgi:class I fructose-bisphosphate aldolase
MSISPVVKSILQNYESDNPGVKTNLVRLLTHGRLANTGRMVIYPVDQGFEHGPARSFAVNPDAYDPHYHIALAIDAGLSAFAAPLGMLEAGASTFAGQIPLILKMNSANALVRDTADGCGADQAVTASVADALRLGCTAVGFTIYPGSDYTYDLYEEIRSIAEEAKACGLAVVIWSYPRGNMSKEGETGIDVIGYGAHMACLLGAHVVKVKLPTAHLEQKLAKVEYEANHVPIKTLKERIEHIRQCCFMGRRLVVFSGGVNKSTDEVLEEARAIRDGGGNGHIIGRNIFRRPRKEALDILNKLTSLYLESS